MAEKRRGLARAIDLTGQGVHSGAEISMRLRPHEGSGHGIMFIRTDLADRPSEETRLQARYDNVVNTQLSTTIGNDHGVTISTIEHLMAAFAGCGLDDVVVELKGAEVPIMDGSSHIFVEAIRDAGIMTNGKKRDYIRVLSAVLVEDGDAWARLSPADEFEMEVSIDFPDQVIGQQSFRTAGQNGCWPINFDKDIASARTFGFVDDLARLRAQGFALGANLDNTLAIARDEDGVERIMNDQGLRYDNEFVRHKALDAIGDLALAGAPLIGRFESHKGGHGLNNRLLRALFGQADNFCLEEAK